jgi:hypothetical protein
MFGFLKRVFAGRRDADWSDEEFERAFDEKQAGLEGLLGPMHDLVGHSLIPFEMGGPLHVYYFCEHIEGTMCASMQLIDPEGNGPIAVDGRRFELVMATREDPPGRSYEPGLDLQAALKTATLIDEKEHTRRLCRIMTCIAMYAEGATLGPGHTCDIPWDDDEDDDEASNAQAGDAPQRLCHVILDEYDPRGVGFRVGEHEHLLMLIIEILESERDYALEHGGQALLRKLKDAGVYPYSDLPRQPVV